MQPQANAMNVRSRVPQSGTAEDLAAGFEAEAARWFALDPDDHGVRILRLAATAVRALGRRLQSEARLGAMARVMIVQERRAANISGARSSAELAAQTAKITQLQAEITQLRAENAALAAVAARPALAVVEVQATLQQKDSVTTHERNAAGDLVKSVTEVIRES